MICGPMATTPWPRPPSMRTCATARSTRLSLARRGRCMHSTSSFRTTRTRTSAISTSVSAFSSLASFTRRSCLVRTPSSAARPSSPFSTRCGRTSRAATSSRSPLPLTASWRDFATTVARKRHSQRASTTVCASFSSCATPCGTCASSASSPRCTSLRT